MVSPRAVRLVLLLMAAGAMACERSGDAEVVDVTLRTGETYEFPMALGDEDGARILVQAEHAAVSEIRRDSTSNWTAVYVYVPAEGFRGEDRVQLEIATGSDGASAPTRRKHVTIRFSIRE